MKSNPSLEMWQIMILPNPVNADNLLADWKTGKLYSSIPGRLQNGKTVKSI